MRTNRVAWSCASLAAGTGAMAWAVRGRSSQVFGSSAWRGRPGRKAIALTFDDGPTPSTLRLLDLLASYNLPATFFQCGVNVRRAPELTQAVCAGPHELGNHSHTHPNFALKRPSYIVDDFRRAQDAIAEASSRIPIFVRAPFGVRWIGFGEMQKQLGLSGVMWSVIGLDWALSAPEITARVVSNIFDGGIVCLHDGRRTLKDPDVEPAIEAVRRIIPALLAKGYHFETVSQLLCRT